MQRTPLTTDARSPASLWSGAPPFAATVLGDDPHAGVLIHCQQGRRESVMLAYAILRLRGRGAQRAAHRIRTHRRKAVLVPVYLDNVEQWLRRYVR